MSAIGEVSACQASSSLRSGRYIVRPLGQDHPRSARVRRSLGCQYRAKQHPVSARGPLFVRCAWKVDPEEAAVEEMSDREGVSLILASSPSLSSHHTVPLRARVLQQAPRKATLRLCFTHSFSSSQPME